MATLDRNTLNSNAASRINDNTAGEISEADVRQQMIDLADSNLNRTTDRGVLYGVPKKMSVDIGIGLNTIVHNVGLPARHVTFCNDDDWQIELPWRIKSTAEYTTIEVNSAEAMNDVSIYITCFN